MPKRLIIEEGDIIEIPLDAESKSYAQIIKKNIILYLLVFDGIFLNPPAISEILNGDPIFSVWTMDAKLYHGEWRIVGSSNIRHKEYLDHKYTILRDGRTWIEDVDGNIIRLASEEEVRKLHARSSYSPALVEKAIRSFHGLEEKSDHFADLF
jgi:hypothetical protein